MAEIAMKIAVNKLVQQVNLLSGVHEDVNWIRGELEIISHFLEEADARGGRGNPNDINWAWVKQLREVAHRIEDAIDRYVHHLARRHHRKRSIRFYHKLKRALKLKSRHGLATEIGDIRTTIQNIIDRDRYTVILAQHGRMIFRPPRPPIDYPKDALFPDKAQLVGIEAHTVKLERWLEEGATQKVIALVGMGGSGKTTLAQQVYDSLPTDEFTCRAWISVSQSYKLEELLRSMIKQFYESCRNPTPQGIHLMDAREMVVELREYMEQRRYVVVFDDVWSLEFWQHMRYALPENNRQSRILITTRRKDVAPSNCVYELQPLTFEHAWELFVKMVFHSIGEERCPPELEDLSARIVEKCEGLPLAIVTLAFNLSENQKSFSEFKVFHDMINEHLAKVSKILTPSYDDLPLHLKSCLLYFGLFPKGCSIRGSRLIRQWIAEGFIEGKVNRFFSFEDLAESYLKELACRSLIQVSEIDYSGKAKKYRVCDLMHNLLLSKVDELNFCAVLEEDVSVNLDGHSRRLSIMTNPNNLLNACTNASAIRSVFCFEVVEFPRHFASTLFRNFKLLTMLDFENAPLEFIPESVGNLFNMKYFSIRNTGVKYLPESTGKLQQLETLDTKHSLVQELPVQTRRLRKLRNLLAYHCNSINANDHFSSTDTGLKIPQGLGCKETLQKLSLVELDGDDHRTKELENFKQLRKLGVTKVRGKHGTDLCSAIEKMKQLRSLKIILLNDQEIVDLQSLDTHHPPLLQHLCLKGRLAMLPNWISELQSLVRLRLHWTGLEDDPLLILQDLPYLLELTISNNAYTGQELQFLIGFRKLKVLRLEYLDTLRTLALSGSSLQHLDMMVLLTCIPNLKNLQVLQFYDMPEEFCMSIVPEPNEGTNYSMVRDITVSLSFTSTGPNQYETFSLQEYGLAHM